MKKLQFNKNTLIITSILAVFIGLSLYLGSVLNIWEDEICTLKSTEKDSYYAFNQALKFEGQPPVYFVILNLWRSIDNGILFSRIFSMLAIVISSFILLKILKDYVPGINKHVALTIFLFNPVVVWAATEVRHYAFSILLSFLLFLFFTRGFASEKHDKKNYRFWYYITAFFSLYTFYFFAFFLLANGLFLALRKRWRDFGYYCLNMTILLLPMIFIYSIIQEQIMMHDQTLYTPISFYGRLQDIIMGLQNYLFSMFLLPINEAGRLALKIIILLFIIMGLYKFKHAKTRVSFWNDNNSFLLLNAVIVILFMYLAILSVFPRLYFTDRYLVILFPLLTVVLLKFIWSYMPSLTLKKILLIGIIMLYVAGNYYYFKIPVKKFDYIMAADYLSKNVNDGKPILFYRSVLGPIFKYYYSGKSNLYDLPDSAGYTTDFLDKLHTEQQFDSILKKIGGHDFCLVADDQIQDKYSVFYNRPMLYEYMKKKGVIIKDTIFYGRANFFYFRITEFKTDTTKWRKISWQKD